MIRFLAQKATLRLSVLLALTLVAVAVSNMGIPSYAYADDALAPQSLRTQGVEVTVADANGKVLKTWPVSNDITSALGQALEYGKSASGYAQTTVTVPAGSFTLNTDRHVRIFSNTNLILDKNTVITQTGNQTILKENNLMIESAHFTQDGSGYCSGKGCTHGGYSQIQNVHIEGGVFDGNCAKNPTWNISGILMQHGENLTLTNVSFKNFTNHALNIAGTKNVKVTNCAFSNSVKFTGTSTRFWGNKKRTAQGVIDRIRSTESVHTDFCSKSTEVTAFPLDNTACQNIIVTACNFNNTYSGVGTHHEVSGTKMKNIQVLDCTFKLKDGNAVNLFTCGSATVRGNKLTGGYSLVRADLATASVTNNTINSCEGNGISAVRSSKLTVKKNTVKKAAAAGILISDKSTGTVTSNKITCAKAGTGINVAGGKATVKSNTVKGGAIGIAMKTPSGVCKVTGNKVTNVNGNGLYVFFSTKGKVTLSGNNVSKSSSAGVRVDKSSKVTISKNTITESNFGASISTSKSVTVNNNTMNGGTTVIRVTDKSTKINVTGNKLKKKGKLCSSNAIYFFNKCTGSVTKNTIVKPGTNGIRIDNKCKVTVKGNKVSSPGGKAIAIN